MTATERPLGRGATGPAVLELQVALERAGYALPGFGADGSFGRETAAALARFQNAARLPATGTLDSHTRGALWAAGTPRAPEYAQLFADGVLNTTLAVGYDEAQSHLAEVSKVRAGLSERGFRAVEVATLTASERARLGLEDASGEVFMRTYSPQGQPVTAVLRLVTPDTPGARDRFVEGLSHDELVLYGGHGRYGSGPDFDDIHSPAGNFVIGRPSTPGKVTLGADDIGRTRLAPGYQLLFFDGCNTFRYFDDLRAKTPGKSTSSLDVIGSTTELYWNETADNLFTVLDGVMRGDDADAITGKADRLNRTGPSDATRYFVTNGFSDNPPG